MHTLCKGPATKRKGRMKMIIRKRFGTSKVSSPILLSCPFLCPSMAYSACACMHFRCAEPRRRIQGSAHSSTKSQGVASTSLACSTMPNALSRSTASRSGHVCTIIRTDMCIGMCQRMRRRHVFRLVCVLPSRSTASRSRPWAIGHATGHRSIRRQAAGSG